RYTQGDKSARRPPELLTRDHVARCIVREIREGRGSPHGGVFLDISWLKRRLSDAKEHIRKKLPSMYHQFLKLAAIDIPEQPIEDGMGSGADGGPFQVQQDLQKSMQGLVGIVRNEGEMAHALDALAMFADRARHIRIGGNRAYNPAWHTALDLHNLLTVSEAIARSALERKESRGAHFREDFPEKVAEPGRVNILTPRGSSGE